MSRFVYTKQQIEDAVKISTSWREVIKNLNSDANYKGSECNLKKKAVKLGIVFSHFLGQAHNKGKTFQKVPIEKLFESETIGSCKLRDRLFKENIKQRICESCNLEKWLEQPIPLELHHIDENPKNNKLENLKILCSNCHSLAHKKIKIPSDRKNKRDYRERHYQRKLVWPFKEELEVLVWQYPTSSIAKIFNVSDKAVDKWCKRYKIEKPKRGYWAKQKAIVA